METKAKKREITENMDQIARDAHYDFNRLMDKYKVHIKDRREIHIACMWM